MSTEEKMDSVGEDAKKICFVISPIGSEGSEIRRRSDQVLRYIFGPAATKCGYKPVRADQISEPGIITSQVIQHVVDDPLVLADLTGHNPNVLYELAIRHAIKKPVVQVIAAGESLPFDVAASRTVFVDHHDLDSVSRAEVSIVEQIRAVERNAEDVDTPVSVAMRIQFLAQSDNPLEQNNATILAALQEIQGVLLDLRVSARRPAPTPSSVLELGMMLSRLWQLLSPSEARSLSPEELSAARAHLKTFAPLLQVLYSDAGLALPEGGWFRSLPG